MLPQLAFLLPTPLPTVHRHRTRSRRSNSVQKTPHRHHPHTVRVSPVAVQQQQQQQSDTKQPTQVVTPVLQRFLTWFRGDFDNYDQAASDRSPTSEIARRERHEHIHCRIQLVPGMTQKDILFATYYYDGNPAIVYRRRLYTLCPVDDKTLEMQIYKMGFIHGLRVARANCDLTTVDMGELDDTDLYERLEGAEIVWRYEEEKHEGQGFVENGGHFVGIMKEGGFTASDGLRYEDELVLTKEDLWVGERVYNSDGVMVGGNKDGIAHKMRRVRHTDDDLRWTLNRDLADVNVV